jgi:regulator of PEP synthase PpsR (kinase-PPPase family)
LQDSFTAIIDDPFLPITRPILGYQLQEDKHQLQHHLSVTNTNQHKRSAMPTMVSSIQLKKMKIIVQGTKEFNVDILARLARLISRLS